MPVFDYATAFSRNLGWLTETEQQTLRRKRVAIAGLGGVGGSHLITLTRLGIGAFNVSDLDQFELANFNRQAGATVSTIGAPKAETMADMAIGINPELEIRSFEDGISQANVAEFLRGVDVYVDGLDYFAVSARKAVFSACAKSKIPAVTAAPLGMGAAVLNFIPGHIDFEEYFQLEGYSELEQLVRFLVGLSPAMLQRGYVIDKTKVDLAQHRGPSTAMACDICAGMAGTQVLKILTGRGRILAAPWGQQFDAYRNKYVKTWRPGGNRNPVQRLTIRLVKKILGISNH